MAKEALSKIDDGDGLISFHECVRVMQAHECLSDYIRIDIDSVLENLRERKREIDCIDSKLPNAT